MGIDDGQSTESHPTAVSGYAIERCVPAAVEAELSRIWHDNLPVAGGAARRFAWLYREAPDVPDSVFLLAAEPPQREGAPIAPGRRWVGTAGVLVRRIHVAECERELRAALLADLAVDRDHRSVGPALTLAREVRTWALAHHDLAYGFPNGRAERVFKRVGYQVLGVMPRYARVLRHAGFAARVTEENLARAPAALRAHLVRALKQPAFAALAAAAADAALLALGAADGLDAASRLRLDWLARPDGRFDHLWTAAKSAFRVVARRNARFLDWRFPAAPALSFAVASARRSGEPRAYAVVEREGDAAVVRDLFGHPDDMPALLDLLISTLYTRGVATISIRYLGNPTLAAALTARRFVRREGGRTTTIATALRLAPELRRQLEDPSAWHLTDADEDT